MGGRGRKDGGFPNTKGGRENVQRAGEDTEKSADNNNHVNIDQKAVVSNKKLQNIVNDLYKGQDRSDIIGNGTTMDAVRSEMRTGQSTKGKFHMQKLKQYLNALRRRLRAGDLNSSDMEQPGEVSGEAEEVRRSDNAGFQRVSRFSAGYADMEHVQEQGARVLAAEQWGKYHSKHQVGG